MLCVCLRISVMHDPQNRISRCRCSSFDRTTHTMRSVLRVQKLHPPRFATGSQDAQQVRRGYSSFASLIRQPSRCCSTMDMTGTRSNVPPQRLSWPSGAARGWPSRHRGCRVSPRQMVRTWADRPLPSGCGHPVAWSSGGHESRCLPRRNTKIGGSLSALFAFSCGALLRPYRLPGQTLGGGHDDIPSNHSVEANRRPAAPPHVASRRSRERAYPLSRGWRRGGNADLPLRATGNRCQTGLNGDGLVRLGPFMRPIRLL